MTTYVGPSKVESGGSGLFSSKDVKPGELILTRKRPLISVLDSKWLPEFCSNCFATAINLVDGIQDHELGNVRVKACNGCKTLRYCSKQCQAESWKYHHKAECKLLQKLSERGTLPATSRAVLQMLHRTSTDEPPPFRGMEVHFGDISRHGGERYETLLALSTGIHHYTGTNLGLEFVQYAFANIQTNSFTLVSPTYDPLGLVLDPHAAKANHSCDPNAFVVFDGAKMSFRSLKPITKDEEIFVSYIDVTNPFHRRQHDLRTQYFFDCHCPKCQLGPTLKEDKFLKDPASLSRGWDKNIIIAPGRFTRFAQQPLIYLANYIGDDTASSTLEAQQWLAFDKLEEAKKFPPPAGADMDDTSALKVLKEGLFACLQTKIWPEHRQPLPALRQALFTELLSSRFDGLSWSFAFKQGLRLYFDVHPVLYPETFHPGRVIHKWTLAKLALLLADPQTPTAGELADVDFGVVAYGLLMEVRDNVRQSHGEESRFARMLQRKADEVKVDMTRGDGTQLRGLGQKVEGQWKVLRRVAMSKELDSWISYVK